MIRLISIVCRSTLCRPTIIIYQEFFEEIFTISKGIPFQYGPWHNEIKKQQQHIQTKMTNIQFHRFDMTILSGNFSPSFIFIYFSHVFFTLYLVPFLKWLSHSILWHAKLQIMTTSSSVCLYPFQTFWFWFTFYIEKANGTGRPSTTSIWSNGYVHFNQGVLLYLWRNLLSINIDVLSAKWYWKYVIVATNVKID